ncbi:MAG: metal-dependent hydrolase [Halorientalis sp.]
MWPWEHVAFGFLLWAGYAHLRRRRRVRTDEALAVAVATQFPDLIDKPLAWTFHVLPSGVSLAHSLAFALPVTALVAFAGRRRGRTTAAAAFAVGYGSHLLGDAIYPLAGGGPFSPWFVLWPLVPTSSSATHGLVGNFLYYFRIYLSLLHTPRGIVYAAFELALLGGALAVWVHDGTPGLPALRGSGRSEHAE